MTYLRSLGLTGTKLVCGEGVCGACSVLVATVTDRQGVGAPSVDHHVVTSCTTRLLSLHGARVTTVEGIGGTSSGGRQLHPVQERLHKGHGSQCGFCTPGMVMSMVGLLKNCPTPDIEDVANCIKVYRIVISLINNSISNAREISVAVLDTGQ